LEECMVFAFDFDGVIAYPGGEPRRVGIEALQEALQLGAVYIVTGRPQADRSVVHSLLRREGIPLSRIRRIILRGGGGEVWHKLESYRWIVDVEGCLGEVHDDNAEVLYAARRLVQRGTILHFNEHCEPLTGYTVLESCSRR